MRGRVIRKVGKKSSTERVEERGRKKQDLAWRRTDWLFWVKKKGHVNLRGSVGIREVRDNFGT